MPQQTSSPLTSFADRLATRNPLQEDDRAALLALPYNLRALRRHEFIVREDDPSHSCCVLVSGFAIRHKTAGNGGRQIFSIHMRGDAVDLNASLLGRADHNVQMLSAGEVAYVPVEAIQELSLARPALALAMWRETLLESAIFREWTLNVGRRDARSRMAHMLCEFAVRLEEAHKDHTDGYDLPMTQEELADALALTPIHVSRTLKSLADDGLVTRTKRSVHIVDWHALAKLGDFNRDYLHLPGEGNPRRG